jgi:hypothetical protein
MLEPLFITVPDGSKYGAYFKSGQKWPEKIICFPLLIKICGLLDTSIAYTRVKVEFFGQFFS